MENHQDFFRALAPFLFFSGIAPNALLRADTMFLKSPHILIGCWPLACLGGRLGFWPRTGRRWSCWFCCVTNVTSTGGRRTRLWSSSNSSSRTPRRGRSRRWWKRRKTSSSSKTRQVGSHSCCQSCLEELAPELHILVGEPLQKLSFSSSLTSGSSSFTLRSSSTVPCSGGRLRGKNQNDTLIFRSHADLVGDPWIKSWIKN